jgi:hypothetical protein
MISLLINSDFMVRKIIKIFIDSKIIQAFEMRASLLLILLRSVIFENKLV